MKPPKPITAWCVLTTDGELYRSGICGYKRTATRLFHGCKSIRVRIVPITKRRRKT